MWIGFILRNSHTLELPELIQPCLLSEWNQRLLVLKGGSTHLHLHCVNKDRELTFMTMIHEVINRHPSSILISQWSVNRERRAPTLSNQFIYCLKPPVIRLRNHVLASTSGFVPQKSHTPTNFISSTHILLKGLLVAKSHHIVQ